MDTIGQSVSFSFEKDSFPTHANHVLVVCRFYEQWLLTKHKTRGWEFPGGKKEEGETLEEAAIREVEEETGASLKFLHFIGEYEVTNAKETFVKRVYYADVESLEEKSQFFETDGPVLIGGDLLSLRTQDQYSFIMKDSVMEKVLENVVSRRNGME